MRRSPSRLLFIGFMALFLVTMAGSITTADAQTSDPIEDGKLSVLITLDGLNFFDYNLTNPLPLNMDEAMYLDMEIANTWTQTLNMSGSITFWYQGFALFPIDIRDSNNN
ncbi:MAG: hypothetical protein RTS72_03675, partial [Candidatus Thorarchaeota archaeon]